MSTCMHTCMHQFMHAFECYEISNSVISFSLLLHFSNTGIHPWYLNKGIVSCLHICMHPCMYSCIFSCMQMLFRLLSSNNDFSFLCNYQIQVICQWCLLDRFYLIVYEMAREDEEDNVGHNIMNNNIIQMKITLTFSFFKISCLPR